MRPTGRMLAALTVWCVLGLVASRWGALDLLWWGGGLLLATLALIDALALFGTRVPEVVRELPGRFALGESEEVVVEVHNRARRPVSLDVYDGIPDESQAWDMPWRGRVRRGGFARITYPIKMLARGLATFTPVQVLLHSPMGLWCRRRLCGESEETRVYPNYEPLVRFALLSVESTVDTMGIVHRNRVGISREFHQLRDYHVGDALAQIDWKATSKHRKLISREFQEQRDQSIILAVDCSRRMRTMDGDITQFDHCLNSMLLLAFIALRQGDKVGVLGFGGETRWFPPAKGAHQMTALLNHLYDYQTSPYPSDFSEAAEQLQLHQKRRSLVVLLSNVRSEDSGDLLPALRSIRRRHLVVLGNLREGELDQNLETPVSTLDDALTYSSTRRYLDEREKLFEELAAHGVLSIDSTANSLPIDLANQYLRIKASGKL